MSRTAREKHFLLALGAVSALLPGTRHQASVGIEGCIAFYWRPDGLRVETRGRSQILALAVLLEQEAERSIRPERARQVAAGLREEDARLRGVESGEPGKAGR